MSDSYRQQILHAGRDHGPAAAIRVAASIIETMDERLQKLETDQWGPWDDTPEDMAPFTTVDAVATQEVPLAKPDPQATAASIQLLEEKLRNTGDADDQRALTAKIKLLKMGGSAPEPVAQGERSTISQEGEDSATVELPPVSEEQKHQRREWAKGVGLDDALPLVPGAAEAYVKGGPLWLWYGNRAFVVGLPDSFKKQMVEDVSKQSVQEAKELGADILKDAAPGELPAIFE